MSTIKVGQIYASTHSGDVTRGTRQRRRVTEVRALSRAVWLVTEDGPPYLTARPSRVTLRVDGVAHHSRPPSSRGRQGTRWRVNRRIYWTREVNFGGGVGRDYGGGVCPSCKGSGVDHLIRKSELVSWINGRRELSKKLPQYFFVKQGFDAALDDLCDWINEQIKEK